jgi:hypothetical protein
MRFIRNAALFIGGQLLLWTILAGFGIGLSPLLDSILEPFIFAYYPTILLVDRFGHFVGCSNIILPIFYGILLGIPIYGLVAAAAISVVSSLKGRHQPSE